MSDSPRISEEQNAYIDVHCKAVYVKYKIHYNLKKLGYGRWNSVEEKKAVCMLKVLWAPNHNNTQVGFLESSHHTMFPEYFLWKSGI